MRKKKKTKLKLILMSPRRFEKYEKRNWNNFFFLSSLSVRCFFFVRPFVHSFALEFRVVIVLWYCRPDNWVRVTLQQYANQIYSTRVFLFCLFLVYFPVIFFVLLLQCKQNRIEERSEHNEQEQKISSWSLGWFFMSVKRLHIDSSSSPRLFQFHILFDRFAFCVRWK